MVLAEVRMLKSGSCKIYGTEEGFRRILNRVMSTAFDKSVGYNSSTRKDVYALTPYCVSVSDQTRHSFCAALC